jgi:apolipoprotein D and lipocalin family protein
MISWLRAAPLAFALLGCSQEEPLPVAENVDLARFQGRWYEIAKLPRPLQARCAATTASYELASSSELLVKHECREGGLDGPLRTVFARAVVTDPEVPAKLALDFGFAFGDYWIMEVGQSAQRAAAANTTVGSSYEYAVIGHPTRDYLWILSRTPTLGTPVLTPILERARQQHFPVDLLDFTIQDD